MTGLLVDQNKPNPLSVRHAPGPFLYGFERSKPCMAASDDDACQIVHPSSTPFTFYTYNNARLLFVTLETRTVYPQVPPKVEYSVSDFGETFIPVLESTALPYKKRKA
jgi:hypothetical protein